MSPTWPCGRQPRPSRGIVRRIVSSREFDATHATRVAELAARSVGEDPADLPGASPDDVQRGHARGDVLRRARTSPSPPTPRRRLRFPPPIRGGVVVVVRLPLPVRRRDVRPERGGSNVGVVARWAVARRSRERVKHPRARIGRHVPRSPESLDDVVRRGPSASRGRSLGGARTPTSARGVPRARPSASRAPSSPRIARPGLPAPTRRPEASYRHRRRARPPSDSGFRCDCDCASWPSAVVGCTRAGPDASIAPPLTSPAAVDAMGADIDDAAPSPGLGRAECGTESPSAILTSPNGKDTAPFRITGSMPATIPAEPVWSPRTITRGLLETFPPSSSIERRVRCARAPRPDAQPGRPFAFAKMVASVLAQIVFAVIDLNYP